MSKTLKGIQNTQKEPQSGLFVNLLVIVVSLAAGSNQWLVYPESKKEFTFLDPTRGPGLPTQPDQHQEPPKPQKRPQEGSSTATNRGDFISQLRSKSAPKSNDEQDLGSSIFPFDPDRGYIDIYDENNSMWYWHFRAQNNPETAPLIIFLQGGPGAASSSDVFISNGPFAFKNYQNSDPKVYLKNVTWAKTANLLYPDYPLGVGFSTVTAENVALGKEQVMDQILKFFTKFLQKYPEYKKRPLYVAGVSYGGHWVPYTITALKSAGSPDINIQGFYISDGVMNYEKQMYSYVDFALDNSKYTGFTQEDYNEYAPRRDLCLYTMETRPHNMWAMRYFPLCSVKYYLRMVYKTIVKHKPKFTPYYMPGDIPVDPSFVRFLNNPTVQEYLGVRKQAYRPINFTFF